MAMESVFGRWLDGNGEHPQLRDTLTEGYNPISISLSVHGFLYKKTSGGKFLSFDDKELKAQDGEYS